MNMKKMKKFFTLSRRAEGFTLVELIVVIAILAILGGVAVPAYSGYVKKANMQADISLASEVADALTLYYYSNPSAATIDYVLLTSDGARTADGNTFADPAMQAVFGEGWQDACALKYDGWTTAETAQKVIGSSYLSNGRTADDLLNSVSYLTNMAASAMGSGDAQILADLEIVDQSFVDSLSGYEVGSEEYKNAASNMLVFYVADELANLDPDEPETSLITNWAVQYAFVYAYCAADPDSGKLDELNANLEAASKAGDAEDIRKALEDVFEQAQSAEVEEFISDKNNSDYDALIEIMKAATDMSDSIQSSSDMTSNEMWTSDGVSSTVNQYINAMNEISGLDAGESGILIMIDENGTISIPTNNVSE